jgi:hypothetical protein
VDADHGAAPRARLDMQCDHGTGGNGGEPVRQVGRGSRARIRRSDRPAASA